MKTKIDISYNQFSIFSENIENPFNDCEDQHVYQGFAWRSESVTFYTQENGEHEISFKWSKPQDEDAEILIEVPAVYFSEKLLLASISDEICISQRTNFNQIRYCLHEGKRIEIIFYICDKPFFLVKKPKLIEDFDLLKEARAAL